MVGYVIFLEVTYILPSKRPVLLYWPTWTKNSWRLRVPGRATAGLVAQRPKLAFHQNQEAEKNLRSKGGNMKIFNVIIYLEGIEILKMFLPKPEVCLIRILSFGFITVSPIFGKLGQGRSFYFLPSKPLRRGASNLICTYFADGDRKNKKHYDLDLFSCWLFMDSGPMWFIAIKPPFRMIWFTCSWYWTCKSKMKWTKKTVGTLESSFRSVFFLIVRSYGHTIDGQNPAPLGAPETFKLWTLRITGPCYRLVRMCIARVLGSPNHQFRDPIILRGAKPLFSGTLGGADVLPPIIFWDNRFSRGSRFQQDVLRKIVQTVQEISMQGLDRRRSTWRIIPVSKWLITMVSFRPLSSLSLSMVCK